MSFTADKQTLDDLNLLGKHKAHSVFSIFNEVKTGGGERLLQEMFQQPYSDAGQINRRSDILQFFQQQRLSFPIEGMTFNMAENYLTMGGAGNLIASVAGTLVKKLSASILRDDQFERLQNGLLAAVELLKALRGFWDKQEALGTDHPYREQQQRFESLLSDPRLAWVFIQRQTPGLSVMQIGRYDYLLRHTFGKEMEQLLEDTCLLDVYLAVAAVAAAKGFSYATALPKQENRFTATGLRHPALEKAVANPLSFDKDGNLLFLTGANMAGKSTFMKSFGIAVYLAHMGFPVPAERMEFSVKDGMYSSINVSDDLGQGLSHFYAEVLRVKKVAEGVASGKDLIVIFDELFKGTNVKDAYDGTLSVTEAFASYRNCFFIVSTHIIEVGDALSGKVSHIQLSYLPTVMEGNVPKYTYRLKEGITSDRQGMMIIENEGILEILD